MLSVTAAPGSFPALVAFAALVTAFLSASQDIAIDAYRADVLRERELGPGAATAVVGYRSALLVSGALALILSDHVSWRIVYTLMAAIMLMNTLFTLVAPEPETRVVSPKSLKEAVWGPLAGYFNRSGAVEMLLFIMVYKLGNVIAGAMTTPFLLDIGFSRSDVGMVNKVFGLISTIVGVLVGGGIVSRIGVNRSLWVFGFLQAVSNFAFCALSLIGKSYPAMIAAIGIENICVGMGDAAFIAFMMSLCDKRFTATQYALLTSFMAVSRIVAGAPTGCYCPGRRMARLLLLEHTRRHSGPCAPYPLCALERKGKSRTERRYILNTLRPNPGSRPRSVNPCLWILDRECSASYRVSGGSAPVPRFP